MGWRQRSQRSHGSNGNGTAHCRRRCSRNIYRPWEHWSLQQSASLANSTHYAFAAAPALNARWCFTTPLDPPRSAGMPSGLAAYASGNVVTERVNHRHDSLLACWFPDKVRPILFLCSAIRTAATGEPRHLPEMSVKILRVAGVFTTQNLSWLDDRGA